MIPPAFSHRNVFSFLHNSGYSRMTLSLRYLIVFLAFSLTPLAAHAQSAQGPSSSPAPSISAPILAPQAPGFGNQGATQPGFGNQAAPQSPGFGGGGQGSATASQNV